jgi:hypothetical protein
MPACTICHRTDDLPLGRTCCRRCEGHIHAALREVDARMPLLHAMLIPGSALPVRGTPTHTPPLPARVDVLNLLGAGATAVVFDPHGDQHGPAPINAVLYGWACAITDVVHPDSRHPRATPALRPGRTWSRWLQAYLPWALGQDWVGEMHRELVDLVALIRSITHTEPRSTVMDAPCRCGAFALVETDWQVYITCEACGLLLTADEYRDHRDQVMPGLVHTALLIAAQSAENTAA